MVARSTTSRRVKVGETKVLKLARPRRNFSVGGKTYGFSKKEGDKKTVTRTAGVRTAVYKDKQSKKTLTRTFTKSADAKNVHIGAYARAHQTVNADGSVTFAKKGGGTVTRTQTVEAGMPEGKKGRRRRRNNGSTSNPGGSTSNPGSGNSTAGY